MFGELAVITNPAEPTRHPETAGGGRDDPAARLRSRRTSRTAPSTAVTCSRSARPPTWASAAAPARRPSTSCGNSSRRAAGSVIGVPLTRVLHLKSAVTALPDGTVIGYGPLVDDASVFPAFLGVPEEGGAHVVVLDDETVLMSAHAPRTARLLARPRPDRGHGRHLGVREARGLRDLPVRARPRLTGRPATGNDHRDHRRFRPGLHPARRRPCQGGKGEPAPATKTAPYINAVAVLVLQQ